MTHRRTRDDVDEHAHRAQPAPAGGRDGRGRRRGEQPVVPDTRFSSYYDKPVLNQPTWRSPEIPGYLFLGGLAGASSVLGAGAHLTGRRTVATTAKTGALAAIALSAVALVADLGRPGRFVNMLRVFKPTSPMNVGSWLLAGYGPLAGVSALTAVTGKLPRIGTAATGGAALLGPAVAAYTGALVSDTAVPAWHDGYREMPFVFVGSGAAAAGGLGLLTAPAAESAPARNLAVFGVVLELLAFDRMRRRLGMVAEPYRRGTGGKYVHASEALSLAGLAGAVARPRNRFLRRISGAALMAASVCTRWGVFHAGRQSAKDPKYTVVPQRQRLRER